MPAEIVKIKDMQGYELNGALLSIKKQFKSGVITYDTAKEAAQVILDEMNERSSKIAKKHNKKHSPITFTYVMR